MKDRKYINKIGIVILVIIGIVCCLAYGIKNMRSYNVAIQTIQDEVDLDAQNCTDGADDCKFNIEIFDDTWLYTGKQNMDRLVNFPESVWEEKE